jgi:hypothetical protein
MKNISLPLTEQQKNEIEYFFFQTTNNTVRNISEQTNLTECMVSKYINELLKK